MRILVVEDDPDLRAFLADEAGHEADVLALESGRDAIAVLESLGTFDAVVTDLQLGRGPDGFDVLRAARACNPACARVLVTARRDLGLDDHTSSLVEAVFAKPWIPGTIRTYLRERLAR